MNAMRTPALASPSNPRIKAVARLRDRRHREDAGLTLVDGAREVRRALEAGADVVEAFVCDPLLAGEDARAALDGLAQRDIAITRTSGDERRSGRMITRCVTAPMLAEKSTPTTADGMNAQPAFVCRSHWMNTPAMPIAPMAKFRTPEPR